MRFDLFKTLAWILLILNCFSQTSEARELTQEPAAIHISSIISDGRYSISEIIDIARQNNIKIVIITDRDFMRWQYGLWPLRRVIKRTVETNSVSNFGIKRYLNEIERVQRNNPDLVLIPAVESAPFYYWSGSLFKNNLKLHNWHKHILVTGLKNISDYKNLPSVSNRYSLALPFTFKDIFRFWPILILMIGILGLRKRFKYEDLRNYLVGNYFQIKLRHVLGTILIIVSFLFLLNDFPFRGLKYDQYHKEQGIRPYQNLIDYVNQTGGLTFWAHPEAEYIQKRGRITIETKAYPEHILEAYDYTGFAIFYEGYKQVGSPGGIWDEVLKQYCQGKRKTPVWAIAGLSFDQTGELTERMQFLRTVFLIPELSKAAVLQALKEGKMYAVKGQRASEFILDRFIVSDTLTDAKATIGEEILLRDKPKIRISGHFLNRQEESVTIRLIRNGKIIKIFEVSSPFDISYSDDYINKGEKIYYRLDITSPGGILVTNPIFIKFD